VGLLDYCKLPQPLPRRRMIFQGADQLDGKLCVLLLNYLEGSLSESPPLFCLSLEGGPASCLDLESSSVDHPVCDQ